MCEMHGCSDLWYPLKQSASQRLRRTGCPRAMQFRHYEKPWFKFITHHAITMFSSIPKYHITAYPSVSAKYPEIFLNCFVVFQAKRDQSFSILAFVYLSQLLQNIFITSDLCSCVHIFLWTSRAKTLNIIYVYQVNIIRKYSIYNI